MTGPKLREFEEYIKQQSLDYEPKTRYQNDDFEAGAMCAYAWLNENERLPRMRMYAKLYKEYAKLFDEANRLADCLRKYGEADRMRYGAIPHHERAEKYLTRWQEYVKGEQ